MGIKKHYAQFERFEIALIRADARMGSHQGACDADIAELRKVPYIKRQLDALDPDALRAELSEYGAWDDDELADLESCLDRILWLACGNIVEELAA